MFIVTENKNKCTEQYTYWLGDLEKEEYAYEKECNNETLEQSHYENKIVNCLVGNCENHELKYEYFKNEYLNVYLND